MEDKISIVIPCLNEENYIEGSLLSLKNSDYPVESLEILIIDGGSTDSTLSKIKKIKATFPEIQIINNPQKITPRSLNIGVQNATGDYVMIASAHSQFPPNYISFLMQKLKEIKCDCIGGGIDTKVANSTPVSEAIIKLLSSRFGVGNSSFRTEKNATLFVDTIPFGIYKRSLFKEVGYYNEKLVRNHDIEFSKRLLKSGYKIVLVSSIRCTYFARETYKKFALNNFFNGVWNIRTLYITKQFKSLSIRHFIPLIFLLSLILPFIMYVSINKNFIYISLFSIFIYTCFVISASISLKDHYAKFMYIIWGFFVLHFSYGFGSLYSLFRIDKLISRS
jgi:glycosyltransferase involved in cell wall biosynthesis